jgi:hypothetical protein
LEIGPRFLTIKIFDKSSIIELILSILGPVIAKSSTYTVIMICFSIF